MRRTGRRGVRSIGGRTFAQRIRAMGAVSHLDPQYGASDDGTTSTWNDRLLAGHSLVSASQATRLQYSSSIAGLNGLPGWNGLAAENRRLVSTGSQLATLVTGSAAFTTYVVRRANPVVASIVACWGHATAGSDYNYFGCLTNGVSALARFDTAQTANIGTVQNQTSKVIESYVYTGTTAAIWSNGAVALAAAANTRSIDVDRMCVGGLIVNGVFSSPFSGEIGDIITFLGAHTQAQRWVVEGMLAARYAITVVQA